MEVGEGVRQKYQTAARLAGELGKCGFELTGTANWRRDQLDSQ